MSKNVHTIFEMTEVVHMLIGYAYIRTISSSNDNTITCLCCILYFVISETLSPNIAIMRITRRV